MYQYNYVFLIRKTLNLISQTKGIMQFVRRILNGRSVFILSIILWTMRLNGFVGYSFCIICIA